MKPGQTQYIGDGAYLHFDGHGFELRANHHEFPSDRVYIDGPECAETLVRLIQESLNASQETARGKGGEVNDVTKRAGLLRDQVLKTWSPPLIAGGERPADIAQTAVMQTLAFVFGKEFLGELTHAQQTAIDQGVELMERVLS
jgi:hypothetical protein